MAEPSRPATESRHGRFLGTAIHASIEDLLNMDISDRPKASMGWLPEVGEAFLKDRWNEEKDAFHATPRHGRWKDDRWKEAVDGHRGGIDLLLRWVGVEGLSHERITAALWTRVQERMIAVEGELISRDGRLGGRVDLLLNEVDDAGETVAWVVADLKTGRTPEGKLKPEVDRQLRFYRDLAREQSERTQRSGRRLVHAEPHHVARVKGGVLEDAYAAWEATNPPKHRSIQPRTGQLRRILRLESVVRTLAALAP